MGVIFKYVKVYCLLLLPGLIGISACNDGSNEVIQREREKAGLPSALNTFDKDQGAISIVIDTDLEYQTMDNFGASDCWSAQFVGTWPSAKRNRMADWLFSRDTLPSGQPLGIGLNAWRFNIGAGSAEQGDASQIENSWRRAECFLNADGSYNWNKQAGQQWFLEAAALRGVNRFIGFANSPPVHLTRNGLAHGSEQARENLSKERIDDYTSFLVNVVRGVKEKTGVEFTHLSAFNEPQWDWIDNKQEGCYMENELTRELVLKLNQDLEEAPDLDTRILVSEAGEWDYLYGKGDLTGQQIDHFFGGTNNPLINASRLERVISGHSYYTTHPGSALKGKRESVWNRASSYSGLEVWSTEYCPLGSADLQELGWNSWRKDLSMHVALYVAKIIHHDLVYAHASAWQWWLAISSSSYPDGLIYVSNHKNDGSFTDSKLMWTLGNYSRFISQGAKRVDAVCNESALLITAFTHKELNELTIVVVNTADKKILAHFDWKGISPEILRPYITADIEMCDLYPVEHLDTGLAFEIPAQSAITFTGKLE